MIYHVHSVKYQLLSCTSLPAAKSIFSKGVLPGNIIRFSANWKYPGAKENFCQCPIFPNNLLLSYHHLHTSRTTPKASSYKEEIKPAGHSLSLEDAGRSKSEVPSEIMTTNLRLDLVLWSTFQRFLTTRLLKEFWECSRVGHTTSHQVIVRGCQV